MPGEGKRTGRQPASAMYSGRLGQAPAGCHLFICSVLRGKERREGRGFALPEGAGPLLRDRKYNWAALTLGYGTNQTFLPPPLAHACCLQT